MRDPVRGLEQAGTLDGNPTTYLLPRDWEGFIFGLESLPAQFISRGLRIIDQA